MHVGSHLELQLLVLFVALGAMLVISTLIRLPLPILLVAGGLLLSFAPDFPQVELPPQLVLVAILPPLLYSSAFFTGLRDLRAGSGRIADGRVGVDRDRPQPGRAAPDRLDHRG